MAAVARLYHPSGSGRIDVFVVNNAGDLIQYWRPNGSSGFYGANPIAPVTCDAQATPVAEWDAAGNRVDVWCPTNSGNRVFHWWWNLAAGSGGSETLH